MSDEQVNELAEYVDAKGLTWQLNDADAKRLGYSKVEDKVIDPGDGENKAVTKPARGRRSVTTK